jgi:hypothetical protein
MAKAPMAMNTFICHTAALSSVIVCQHMRCRAVLVHFLRFLGPVGLLFFLWYQMDSFKDMIAQGQISSQEEYMKEMMAEAINNKTDSGGFKGCAARAPHERNAQICDSSSAVQRWRAASS